MEEHTDDQAGQYPDTEALSHASKLLEPSKSKPKRHRRWVIGIVSTIVIIAIGGGALAWHVTHKPAQRPLTKVSVQLLWLDCAEFAGMYVAKDMGYYKAAGLDVDLREYLNSTDVNKEVASGQVDFGVSTPLDVLLARNSGQDNEAIAAIDQTSPYVIAASKASNITTPADFRGKVLGSLGGNDQATVTYTALLASAGLTPAATTIKSVDFDPVKVLQDHEADTADIYSTDQTFLLNQAHVAYNLIYPAQYGISDYGDILIASHKKIAEQPAQVQAFVSATLEGWQYAITHQTKTLKILAKYDNVAYKVPGYEKYVLAATAPLIRPTGNQPFGSMDYAVWNRIYLTAQAANVIMTPLQVQSLYTSQFIR